MGKVPAGAKVALPRPRAGSSSQTMPSSPISGASRLAVERVGGCSITRAEDVGPEYESDMRGLIQLFDVESRAGGRVQNERLILAVQTLGGNGTAFR